jgi:hypothetical protein
MDETWRVAQTIGAGTILTLVIASVGWLWRVAGRVAVFERDATAEAKVARETAAALAETAKSTTAALIDHGVRLALFEKHVADQAAFNREIAARLDRNEATASDIRATLAEVPKRGEFVTMFDKLEGRINRVCECVERTAS